jgi:hypothetical protein
MKKNILVLLYMLLDLTGKDKCEEIIYRADNWDPFEKKWTGPFKCSDCSNYTSDEYGIIWISGYWRPYNFEKYIGPCKKWSKYTNQTYICERAQWGDREDEW